MDFKKIALAACGSLGLAAAAHSAGTTLSITVPTASTCVLPTEQITVRVRVDELSQPAVGYQAFVCFDPARLQYHSGNYEPDVFPSPILPITLVAPGRLRLAAGVNLGDPATMADGNLATLRFNPLVQDCDERIGFCTDGQMSVFTTSTGGAIAVRVFNGSGPIQIDGTPPVINSCGGGAVTVPANAQCRGAIPPLISGVLAKDKCTPTGQLTITQNPLAGTLFAPGTVAVTITVRDCAGNPAICQRNVIIVDNTPPTVTDPPDDIKLPADRNCQATVPNFCAQIVATDNCDTNLTCVQTPAANTKVTGVGNHKVVLTLTDNDFNSVEDSVIITVNDVTQPAIAICASPQIRKLDANCQARIPDLRNNIIAVDNCTPIPLLTKVQNPPAEAVPMDHEPGTITVSVTVCDAAGNCHTCYQTVTFVDNTPPTVACPTAPVIRKLNSNCQALLGDVTGAVSAWDNCDDWLTKTQSKPASSILIGQSEITVIVTVTDDSGNQATCPVTVRTQDNEPPVIQQCPGNIKIDANEDCIAKAPNVGSAVAHDNCTPAGSLIQTQSIPVGTELGPGSHIIVVTVTDSRGLFDTCEVTVMVNDGEPPVITCPPNIKRECTSPDGALISFKATATDNCDQPNQIMIRCFVLDDQGIVDYPIDVFPHQFPIGRTLVRCSATDRSHNSDTCVFSVTVNDTTAPTITCPTASLGDLQAGGGCAATVLDYRHLIMTDDDCSKVLINQVPPVGSILTGKGTHLITFFATDAAGNESSCKASVRVIDRTGPSLQDPTDVKIFANSRCLAQVPDFALGLTATDNCDDPGEIVIAQTPPPGDLLGLGAHTIYVTATDTNGNTTTRTATLTINDNTVPTIHLCPGDDKISTVANACSGLVPDYRGEVVASDNCSAIANLIVTQVPAPNASVPVGTHTVMLGVRDEAGNATTCTLQLTVNDGTPPVIICMSPPLVKAPEMMCQVEVDFPKPIATDNCDMNPNTNGVRDDGLLLHQPFGLGITIIHWTATDAAGNIGTCDQVIEVVDNTPPDFDPCPPDIETKPDLGECFATVDITQPVVRDNCDTNVFVQGTREDGLDLNDPYPADDCITITWVAQDNEGNLSTCYQEVCVRATNTLVVNLQVLEPIINTELTRCFTFVLHDCTGGMVTTVEAEITMIDGQARSAEIEIPCGTWECVTAKDTLHTVRRTSDLTSVANQYHADFTGGNALVPGDLNNDGEVNVLDSGILTGLLTFNYGTGDTSCPIPTTAEYVANPGIAIPDDNNVGISHTINVPDFFFVDDLDIDLVINHTHVGDLCVSITHNGTTVDIIQEIGNANAGCNHAFFGCSSNNLNVVLDDEGTGGALDSLPCPGNTNPFPTSPPNYTPLNPLSAFDGMDASGDWTINVSDTEAADLGTLVTWSLHFDLTPPPPFHADFDGDGIVWMPDCSVIGAYFRAENAPDCCNPRLAGPAAPPLERISVAELLERGLPMVAAGDFNRDGWVDLDDLADAMAAYAATAAPSNPVLEPSGSFAAADGSWFTAANWATGAMPDASSDLSIDARVRVDGAGAQARSLTISQRGGVIISGSLTASSMTVQAGGTLALEAGGILRIGVLNLEPGAILEWSSGVIEVSGGVFHHASLDLVIGSGALRLLNGATAIVTAGAFIGADPAHGGELLVNDSTFIAGNDLVVGFTGDGLLRVIRGGAVHAGALTLTSAATLAGDLTGEIDITGHAQIGGTLTVRLPAGFAEPAIGRRFTLLSAASIDGRFEEVSLPVLPAGLYFELAYGERAIELVVQDSAPGVTPEAEPVPADPAIGAE